MNRDPPKADKSPLRSDKLDAGNALAVAVQIKEKIRTFLISYSPLSLLFCLGR
jgi:hypothetical protein